MTMEKKEEKDKSKCSFLLSKNVLLLIIGGT